MLKAILDCNIPVKTIDLGYGSIKQIRIITQIKTLTSLYIGRLDSTGAKVLAKSKSLEFLSVDSLDLFSCNKHTVDEEAIRLLVANPGLARLQLGSEIKEVGSKALINSHLLSVDLTLDRDTIYDSYCTLPAYYNPWRREIAHAISRNRRVQVSWMSLAPVIAVLKTKKNAADYFPNSIVSLIPKIIFYAVEKEAQRKMR